MAIANDRTAEPAAGAGDGTTVGPDAAVSPGVPREGALAERRRPGRMERASPALIGLLRSHPGADVLPPEDRDDRYALRAAHGIIVATVVGLLIWVGCIWLIAALLH